MLGYLIVYFEVVNEREHVCVCTVGAWNAEPGGELMAIFSLNNSHVGKYY